jgi:WD40 repeat protein
LHIKVIPIRQIIGWLLIIVSFVFGLMACSGATLDNRTATPPTEISTAFTNKDFYQFTLEKEFGNGIVEAAAWAPDGSTFALATSLQVDIYDTQTLEVVTTLNTGQWNQEIAYSPDGKLVAIGGDDKTIQLWDLQSKELVHSFVSTEPEPAYGKYLSLSFRADGQRLVSAHYQTVYLWDISTGKMLDSFPGHIDGIDSVALSPDGNTILAAGSRRIFVRNVASRELQYPPIELSEDITSIYFAPGGQQFYTIHYKYKSDSNDSSSSYDSTIRRWNLVNGKMLEEYPIGIDQINATDINTKQHAFILGERNGFRIWDYSSQKEVFSLIGQTGYLNSIALSPDGKNLITVGSDFGNGLTQIWDLTNKQVIKTFDKYSLPPFGFKLSPDEKYLAINGRIRTTQILDADSGQVRYTLNGSRPLAFSPDSETIAYTEGSDRLVLANAKSGESLPIPTIPCPEITAIAFSPDGKTLALGGDTCDLQIRDALTGTLIKNLSKVQGNEYLSYEDLSFSPDGRILVLSGYRLKILDAQNGETILEDDSGYSGHLTAFSPDGRFLAVSGFGGYTEKEMVQLRDVVSNQIILSIRTLQSDIKQLAFVSDGRTLMIVGESVEFWDIWSGQPLSDVKLTDNPPVGVTLTRDGQNLILMDENGGLQRWSFLPNPQLALGVQSTPTYVPTLTATPDTPKIDLVQIAELGQGYGSDVDYSPDRTIAAFIENNTLKWFDSKSLQELGSLKVGEAPGSVLISPDNKIAVVDGYIGAKIVDLKSGQVLGSVSGGNGSSFGYTFSKDSQYMAYTIGDRSTGGPYQSIGLWKVSTRSDAFTEYGYFPTLLDSRYHTMSAPAINPNVTLVAAGHSDKRVYVWDLHTGETRFILEGHGAEVNSVDFSPNGRWLASGSDDGTIRIWDPSNGKLIRVITGFTDDIWCVRFTPNSQFLQVFISDWQEYLVNLTSNRITYQPEITETPDPLELQQYQQGFSTGASNIFSEVLFSPDGKTLATASQNVLLWEVSSQKLLTFLYNPSGGVLRGMVFNTDGSQLAATTSDEHVLVWDIDTGEMIFSQKSRFLTGASVYYGVGDSEWGPARSRSPVAEQGVAFPPLGNLLAFGNDNVIEIWDVDKIEKVGELINPEGYFATQLSYSTDGKRLYVIINRNRIAQIWDVASAKLIHQVDLPDVDANAYSAIALHGPLFARNNMDDQGSGRIEVWDLDKGESTTIFTDSASNEPMTFSSDGNLLATFANDSQIYIWNTSTGGLVYQSKFDFYAGGISISPDNKYLAVGHSGKASIFDFVPITRLATGQPNLQASLPQATPTPKILAWSTPTAIPTSAQPTNTASDSLVVDSRNASQVREMARFSKGTIDQAIWSPEGDSIIVSGSVGVSKYAVAPWAGSLTNLFDRELIGWTSQTITLPDNRILSTGVESGKVYVWDLINEKVLAELEGGGNPALSPDGKLLVYLNPDGKLTVWDIPSRQSIATLESYSHYPLRPVFSPDGQLVAAVQSLGSRLRYEDSIRVWNARTGAIVNALSGPDNDIANLSFSKDGKFMVGAAGGSAWIWDMRPGMAPEKLNLYQAELKDNLNIYTNKVTVAALSPDNRMLAVGTSEHALKLYDRKTQVVLRELDGHSASIRQLRFSPDGQFLISVDEDGNLFLWNVSSGAQLAGLNDHSGPIGGVLYQLDGDLVAWGEGTTWNIDPSNGQILHTTHIESSGSILAASPAGDLLAVYEPFNVSLLDAQSGAFIQKLEGEADDPFVEYQQEGLVFRRYYAASFSPNGTHLVTAGTGGVWYYDTTTGRLLQQYSGNNAQKISMSPDGHWILTSLYEQINPVTVYDLQSGNTMFSLEDSGRGSDCPQSVFSPDGRWAGTIQITWDGPYQLKIFDTATQQIYKTMSLENEIPLISLAFNPSADLVAVGRADGEILLVDMNEMELAATLTGHHGAVTHLVFSSDGRYLISGSEDGTIRTWGLPE